MLRRHPGVRPASANPSTQPWSPSLIARAGIALGLLFAAACAPADDERRARIVGPADEDVIALGQAAMSDAGIRELRWGVTPWRGDVAGERAWRKMADLLAERLGVAITLVDAADYDAMEALIVGGHADVAVLTPFSAVRVTRRAPGVRVLSAEVAGASTSYGSYIITRDDLDGIESADALRGRTVAFVDERSASGWLYPAAYLIEQGIHPRGDVDARFLGTHTAVYDAVASGTVAAGAVTSAEMKPGHRRNPRLPVRIVAKTARIPYDVAVVRAGFPVAAADAIRTALCSISKKDSAGRKALAPLGEISGFVPASETHLDSVRRVAERLEQSL